MMHDALELDSMELDIREPDSLEPDTGEVDALDRYARLEVLCQNLLVWARLS